MAWIVLGCSDVWGLLQIPAGMPGPMEGAVASILLQLPFYKHVFGWIGGHAAGADPPAADILSTHLFTVEVPFGGIKLAP